MKLPPEPMNNRFYIEPGEENENISELMAWINDQCKVGVVMLSMARRAHLVYRWDAQWASVPERYDSMMDIWAIDFQDDADAVLFKLRWANYIIIDEDDE
jgi:hypothetical protein